MGQGWKGEAMWALNTCLNGCWEATDKNRTSCLIPLLQICSCSLWVAALKFRKWRRKKKRKEKTTYIVQSEILTISLQEGKVKNDLCPPSFRIHRVKSIHIPVLLLLLRLLVNFHICVDLPHKGTCSHVSDGTWDKQTGLRRHIVALCAHKSNIGEKGYCPQ